MAQSDDDSNRHPWKRTAWEARQAVSESLVALPTNYPPQKAVNVSEYHELAQTYLFEYFSVFEPKKDEFGAEINPEDADEDDLRGALWYEPLLSIPLPVDGQVRLNGKADVLKNGSSDREVLAAVGPQVPEQAVTLTLANLRPLFQANNTFQINVKGWVDNQGVEERSVVETRYLPVSGIHAVRAQLDRCLEQAGWLPNFDPGDVDTWSFEVVDDAEA